MNPIFHSSNFHAALTCPATNQPLFNAVALIPCMDKVNQCAAEKLFGPCIDGWKVQEEKSCPVCSKSVIGYCVDEATRNMAKQFVDASSVMLSQAGSSSRFTIPEKSSDVKRQPAKPLPYPGEPGIFKIHYGNWKVYNSGGDLYRHLSFVNAVKGSFVNTFHILGYRDDTVAISISFKGYSQFADYLKSCGFVLDSSQIWSETYKTASKEDTETLFAILAMHNSIPEEYYSMMKDAVEKGSHLQSSL